MANENQHNPESQSTVKVQSDPSHTQPKISKSKLLLILLGIGLAIIIGIVFFYPKNNSVNKNDSSAGSAKTQPLKPSQETQQSPSAPTVAQDITADWKTHNEGLFSVKLPDGWRREKGKYEGARIEFINYDPLKAPQRGFDPVQDKGMLKFDVLVVNTNNNLKTYMEERGKEIAQREKEFPELNQGEKLQVIPVALDDQRAIKEQDAQGISVFVKHPTKPAILQLGFYLDFNNNQKLAEQILFTFKFTQ